MTEAKPSSQGKDSCSLEACLSGFNSAYLIRTFLPTGSCGKERQFPVVGNVGVSRPRNHPTSQIRRRKGTSGASRAALKVGARRSLLTRVK